MPGPIMDAHFSEPRSRPSTSARGASVMSGSMASIAIAQSSAPSIAACEADEATDAVFRCMDDAVSREAVRPSTASEAGQSQLDLRPGTSGRGASAMSGSMMSVARGQSSIPSTAACEANEIDDALLRCMDSAVKLEAQRPSTASEAQVQLDTRPGTAARGASAMSGSAAMSLIAGQSSAPSTAACEANEAHDVFTRCMDAVLVNEALRPSTASEAEQSRLATAMSMASGSAVTVGNASPPPTADGHRSAAEASVHRCAGWGLHMEARRPSTGDTDLVRGGSSMSGRAKSVLNDSKPATADCVSAVADESVLASIRHAMDQSTLKESAMPPQDGNVVLRCEQKAEEWHFDEFHLAAKTAELKNLARAFKGRTATAREHTARLNRQANEHAHQVCYAVEEDDQRRAAQLSTIREELVEVTTSAEQLRQDCDNKVVQIERQIMAERERRQVIEEDIKDERRLIAEVKRRVAEIERDEIEEMSVKDKVIRRQRENAKREAVQAQRVAEEKVRLLELETKSRLQALQREIDAELKKAATAASEHKKARILTLEAAGNTIIKNVDSKVVVGLYNTRENVLDMADASLSKITEVQARDFGHEEILKDHISTAISAMACAAEEAEQASEVEKDANRRRYEAVNALGGQKTFSKTSQFHMLYRAERDHRMRVPLDLGDCAT